jgi:hypothetical protein
MRLLVALVLLLTSVSAGFAQQSPNLVFVTEYVRQLYTNERNRELGQRELSEKNADPLAVVIRSGTRSILELETQIRMLEGMGLSEPFAELPNSIAEFYRQKIEAYNSSIKTATTFMSGPKPGFDYGALAAEEPKNTALMEHIDRGLFQATGLVL